MVVLGKKWSCLEKSGHFLEKSGIDVKNSLRQLVILLRRIISLKYWPHRQAIFGDGEAFVEDVSNSAGSDPKKQCQKGLAC